MPLKNGNTVAAERRMDLASLFCMIGRHGPAVALAVIAMVSVLAGFIIYRTVRGKRRKATAAAADGDSQSPGAEGDASVIQPSPEESHGSVESTDVSDEGSSDMKEDVDMIQRDLKIRHRRAAAAAAEKTPPPYSPPKCDIQVPDNKHTTSDDTEEVAAVCDSCEVPETYAEEADQSLQSDTYTEAEMVVEDAVDWQQSETDDAVKHALDEFHDNDSRLKEPELTNDENHEEEEKVLKQECQEDEDVTAGRDVSDKTPREVEDNLQCALSNPMCFEQTLHTSENSNDDSQQDVRTTNSVDSNSEEPAIRTEDASVPCVSYGKDEEFGEENPDSINYGSYSSNNHLSSEVEKKNESEEAEEECLDHQLTVPQAEVWSSTSEQEADLPSTQQEQDDHLTDKAMPLIQDSDWDEDGGLAGEEAIDEEHLNKPTALKFDARLPRFNVQHNEIEPKEENGLPCDQEDGVLYDGADEVEEKMLTGDNIVVCREECESLSVTLIRALPCLNTKADNHDNGLSGISGIADFADLSSDYQQPQREDKIDPSLGEDTNSTILVPQMASHEAENQNENTGNGTTVVLAEERNDQVYDHVQSGYKDQESVTTIENEAFDEASVIAVPDAVESVIASVIVEDTSCPYLPSICQDHQSHHAENYETSEESRVDSATDACNNASCTALSMSEEISSPDMSSSKDHESDPTTNNEELSEVTTGAAPVIIEDVVPPMCQIQLTSFEQFELRDNNRSGGVGEESGISSMTVSPDAGNEFDAIFENMACPVMDCDLQSDGQLKVQNSFFADDAATSVIKDDTAGMVFGPYPSRCSQPAHSERTGLSNYESFVANEDTFGHEIEDGYHRAMDQFMAQIANSVTSFTDELEKQSDMKVAVEVVEVKEKKAGVSVEKKEEPDAEKEKEEDCEKTEISIMEATMDHNEWIMDSNYQTVPWMNLSAPSFGQDCTKTNQLPTEECQFSTAVSDITCIATTDISSSTEVHQTSTLSLVDESTENNKRVVAVQPMPQNVNVTFRIHYFTQSPYQTVAVTGDQQELGNWKGFIPLERAKDGHWAKVVSLPAESHVEWKFVVVDKGEVCRWEECGNRLLDTGYGDDLLVQKWWGRL